jgi:hypothetical protein
MRATYSLSPRESQHIFFIGSIKKTRNSLRRGGHVAEKHSHATARTGQSDFLKISGI